MQTLNQLATTDALLIINHPTVNSDIKFGTRDSLTTAFVTLKNGNIIEGHGSTLERALDNLAEKIFKA